MPRRPPRKTSAESHAALVSSEIPPRSLSIANTASKRARAYRDLGVDPAAVARAPQITPLLRKLPGGEFDAVNYLRASAAEDARRFLKFYDDPRLPLTLRDLLPIEAFCLAAAVEPPRLLGIIVETAHLHGATMGAMIAAVAHPRIVEVSVQEALKPEGWSDREHNLKHMGFLPTPKGSQVNVNVQANSTVQSAVLTPVPSPEDAIRKLQDKFNERIALPEAGADEPLALGEGTQVLDAMAPVTRHSEDD